MNDIEQQKVICRVKRDAYLKQMNKILKEKEKFGDSFGDALFRCSYNIFAVQCQSLAQIEDEILNNLEKMEK